PPRGAEGAAAYSTPTIVHFSTALLISALLRVPWPTPAALAALWVVIGVMGAIYVTSVAQRIRRPIAYRPEFEDWLCHVVLPAAAYTMLALSGIAGFMYMYAALFGVGAATLLLLFIGIHNAWDGIAYQVFVRMRGGGSEQGRDEASKGDLR